MEIDHAKDGYGLGAIRWDDMVIMVRDHTGSVKRINEITDWIALAIANTYGGYPGGQSIRNETADRESDS